MGHEKVARLPFCSRPCDILCSVNMYIAQSEQWVNSRAVTIPPPRWSRQVACCWPWLISLVERCVNWRRLCRIVQADVLGSGVTERVAIVEACINTGSIRGTREIFGSKFPGKGLPAKRAIQVLVKKWRATDLWLMPQNEDPLQFARQKLLTTFAEGLCRSPKKSTRKLSHQAHVSRTTCRRVSRSQAISCNGCATVIRDRRCETSKLLHLASE